MKVFIQERSGDYNLDTTVNDVFEKETFLSRVRDNGGYFCGDVFVPWHRIDFIKFED